MYLISAEMYAFRLPSVHLVRLLLFFFNIICGTFVIVGHKVICIKLGLKLQLSISTNFAMLDMLLVP